MVSSPPLLLEHHIEGHSQRDAVKRVGRRGSRGLVQIAGGASDSLRKENLVPHLEAQLVPRTAGDHDPGHAIPPERQRRADRITVPEITNTSPGCSGRESRSLSYCGASSVPRTSKGWRAPVQRSRPAATPPNNDKIRRGSDDVCAR